MKLLRWREMRKVSFILVVCSLACCGCSERVEVVQKEITISSPIRQTVIGKNYSVPYFVDNPEAKDCSYEDLMVFLRTDKTDQLNLSANEKSLNSCEFYALTLHDNAEKIGIRCGFTGL